MRRELKAMREVSERLRHERVRCESAAKTRGRGGRATVPAAPRLAKTTGPSAAFALRPPSPAGTSSRC